MTQTRPSTLTHDRPFRPHEIDHEADELARACDHEADPQVRAQIRERIVLLALPLADGIAGRYARRGIEIDDLVQVARTALVKVVARYRPGAGAGFSAFATPSIAGELKRWFRDQGWSVRPPRRVQELRALLVVEEELMQHALAREPQDTELASALGVTARDVAEARSCSAGYRAASLDAVPPSGTALADQILVEDGFTDSLVMLDALGWAVRRLSERQRLILRLRFVDELTQEAIGRQIGVSQMQVSRLLSAALDRLRADLTSELDAHGSAA
jgi:RNA polymerase sigma-B factor